MVYYVNQKKFLKSKDYYYYYYLQYTYDIGLLHLVFIYFTLVKI